jgi:hypothetical protein
VTTGRAIAHARAVVLAAALCAGCATGVIEVREPDGDVPARKTLAVQSTALNPRNGGQLVGPIAAYALRQVGLPLSDAAPRWLSPRDILHMREGDVPSVKVRQTLTYVGHLKYNVPGPLPEGGSEVQ